MKAVISTSSDMKMSHLKWSDESFEVVWSQEAFLHGANKNQIISEAKRVLVPGGKLIFTDLVVAAGTSPSDRERIYERVRSPVMWEADDYHRCLLGQGFQVLQMQDWSAHVARSYSWIRDQVEKSRDVLLGKIDSQTIDRTMNGLGFWVDSVNGWAFFAAVKPHALLGALSGRSRSVTRAAQDRTCKG